MYEVLENVKNVESLLECAVKQIHEAEKTINDEIQAANEAREKYGDNLIRIHWAYAGSAFNNPNVKHVCTWSNGDEGFIIC